MFVVFLIMENVMKRILKISGLNNRKVAISHQATKLCSALAIFALAMGFLLKPGYASEMVNINQADATTLAASLTGVGPVKAQAIVDYRKLHGEFSAAEELMLVEGIGAALFERLKPYLSLGVSDITSSGLELNQSATVLSLESGGELNRTAAR